MFLRRESRYHRNKKLLALLAVAGTRAGYRGGWDVSGDQRSVGLDAGREDRSAARSLITRRSVTSFSPTRGARS